VILSSVVGGGILNFYRMNYWLMKSEPSAYSIDDLKKKKVDAWGGVRNYQARNFMMAMKMGDGVLFYHSSAKPNGVYGLAKVAKLAHPDQSQFDTKDSHFDQKATKEKPIWQCVDVQFVKKFKAPISLEQIKRDKKLAGMRVREVGSRLSVQPVSKEHFEYIVYLANMFL
jgi:predicted RNA-binding protein with PUA-like domain